MTDIRVGLDKVQEAVRTRASITERYRQYSRLSKMVQVSAAVTHSDFKHAVDAIYYFGGGWPSEGSKGRMEKLLDNFVGMYKVLTFIGKGQMVEEHLEKHGIRVFLDKHLENYTFTDKDITMLNEEFEMKEFGFQPRDCVELVDMCVTKCTELQQFICQNADHIKFDLKPGAKENLEIEDEEYDRVFHLTKQADRPMQVIKKKKVINQSLENFKVVAKHHL